MLPNTPCVWLALVLLLGTQLATSKSVVETFKDDQSEARALIKRDVSESSTESGEADSTTYESTESAQSDDDDGEGRDSRPGKGGEDRPSSSEAWEDGSTSEPIVEDADDQEEASTLKSPDSKLKPPKKHKRPLDDEEDAGPRKPASNLLPPMPYYPERSDLTPPAFAPPPMFAPPAPGPYFYPHPSGPAFSDSQVGGFASASASAGGNGATVATSTYPGGVQSGPSSGPFPGGSPVQFSSSSQSGPGLQISTSSQTGPGFASQSASASAGSGPGGPLQPGSFIGSRGSFGDDESVGIEVNGPSGVPVYPSIAPNYAFTGPGYSGSGAGSYAPGQFANSMPSYGAPFAPVDFQTMFQQYFAALQAQQAAFQQQIQAQIAAQQQAGGTFASGGAFITNDRGQVDPNAQVQVNTQSSSNSASSATQFDSRSGFGGSKSSAAVSFPSTNKTKSNNSIWDQSNRVDSNFGAGTPSNYGGPQSAFASANIGPKGGFQSGQISPAGPGIFSRFGEEIPPPSGGSYGVFSSSSSSSATGPNGKTINQKSATVGVNDNGKVSYKTVHDP